MPPIVTDRRIAPLDGPFACPHPCDGTGFHGTYEAVPAHCIGCGQLLRLADFNGQSRYVLNHLLIIEEPW